VSALMTINRASRVGNITAAEMVLKRHPEAKPYRPAEKHEVSGPEGEPISLDVKAKLRLRLEGVAERLAANTKPTPAAQDPEPPEAE